MTATDLRPHHHERPEDEWIDWPALDDRPRTILEALDRRLREGPDDVAVLHPRHSIDGPTTWVEVTWRQVHEQASALAAGLNLLGLHPSGCAAIMSPTRWEWLLADTAVTLAGAVTATIYPSTMGEDMRHIITDSGATVLIVDGPLQIAKFREIRGECPAVTHCVLIDGTPEPGDDHVVALGDLLARGRRALEDDPGLVARLGACVAESSVQSLGYTSGTTGLPKGVPMTHGNWTYEGAACVACGVASATDLQFLWLPLAHTFGKLLWHTAMHCGCTTAIDGDPNRLARNLAEVRPTLMASVPRVLERIFVGVRSAAEADPRSRRLYRWAIDVATRRVRILFDGGTVPRSLEYRVALADALVLSRIRRRFGGRLRTIISGSAALSTEIIEWFAATGMLIIEGYGLTETGGGTMMNRRTAMRPGSVGWPVPGTEIRVDDDGEVLVRGPGTMTEYHNLPDRTAETITPDGWIRTGDLGAIDDRGFLTITGRKKEIFKLSTGKYVSPSRIESRFASACPYASQMVVAGANRKFASALIALDPAAITAWAADNGVDGETLSHFANSAEIRELIAGYVDKLNESLNPWERIGRFTIIDREFTVDHGEITPTAKLRRSMVLERFGPLIDAHYGT